jgi:hypothetical protein
MEIVTYDEGNRFPDVDGPNVFVGGGIQIIYGGFWMLLILCLWPSARVPTLRRGALLGFIGGLLFAGLLNFDAFFWFELPELVAGPLLLVFPMLTSAWILRRAGRRPFFRAASNGLANDPDPPHSRRRRRGV